MHTKTVLAVVTISFVTTSLLLGSAASPALAQSESPYEITVEGSIDTPTREVNIRDGTYEVSAIAKSTSGSPLDVTVQAPDESYQVFLYNAEEDAEEAKTADGNATVEFELAELDAGTYMFAVVEGGTVERIHPLVIKGYEASAQVPDSGTVGESFTVEVSTEQIQDNVTADRVEVVVAGQNTQIAESASLQGDTYTKTIDTSSFSSGSYRVYANVRGENTEFNQQEIIGVSDAHTIELDPENSESSGDSGSDPGSGSDSDSDDSDSSESNSDGSDTTDSADQNPSATEPPTDGPTGEIQPETTTSASDQSSTSASSNDDTESETTTNPQTPTPDVTTPNENPVTTSPTTIPGFSIQTIAGLVVVSALIVRLSN